MAEWRFTGYQRLLSLSFHPLSKNFLASDKSAVSLSKALYSDAPVLDAADLAELVTDDLSCILQGIIRIGDCDGLLRRKV